MYRAKPKYIIRSLYFRRSPVPACVVPYGAEEAKKECFITTLLVSVFVL
jgi:hypothetical protein